MTAKKTTTTSATTELQELRQEVKMADIVIRAKQYATDATAKAVELGGMILDYLGGLDDAGRADRKKELRETLAKEGLDANITRLVQVHCLTELAPEAASLSLGVAARLGSLTRWSMTKAKAIWKKDDHTAKYPKLLQRAIEQKWTEKRAGEEIANLKGTQGRRNNRPSPVKASQALAWIKDHQAELVAAIKKDQGLRNAVQSALSKANAKLVA